MRHRLLRLSSTRRYVQIEAYQVDETQQARVQEISENIARALQNAGIEAVIADVQQQSNHDQPNDQGRNERQHIVVPLLDVHNLEQQKRCEDIIRSKNGESTVSIVGNWSDAVCLQDFVNKADGGEVSVRSEGICHFPSLTVVCGPMFAGKTSRLVDYYERIVHDTNKDMKVLVLKPSMDDRTAADVVRSHDGRTLPPARAFTQLDFHSDFVENHSNVDLFLIDEGHFFGVLLFVLSCPLLITHTVFNLNYVTYVMD